jgi:methylglutaconyl-CoA hydratase
VVVLTGAGRVFCSGADLAERLHPPANEPVTLAEVLGRIARQPQPVVVRVNGHVRAGGLGLVAAGDIAVAPLSATFALSEVRVGVAAAMVAVPILRVMDRRAFCRFALTGEVFGAKEAAGSGLLTEAVDDDGLDAWVDGAVSALLEGSPPALSATKGLADLVGGKGWDEGMAAAAALSAELFASPEAAEGMAAFLEKRRPAWAPGT